MATVDQLYDEAIALQEDGKLEEAVGKLETIVADKPDYALARAALGVFYSKLDRHEEAVTEAREVCRLEPDDPFNYMAMSMICQKAGNREEAEQAMSQAMEKQWATRQSTDG